MHSGIRAEKAQLRCYIHTIEKRNWMLGKNEMPFVLHRLFANKVVLAFWVLALLLHCEKRFQCIYFFELLAL